MTAIPVTAFKQPATTLDHAWLRHAYVEQGWTLRALEAETGVNRKGLSQILTAMGVSMRIGRPLVDDAIRAQQHAERMSARAAKVWNGTVRAVGVYDADQWFIYLLIDPRNYDVRYVGQTTHPDRRLAEHLACVDGVNPAKDAWIAGLAGDGMEPLMQVVATGSGDFAHLTEAEWIDRLFDDGADLLNLNRPVRRSRIRLIPASDLSLPGLDTLGLTDDATLPTSAPARRCISGCASNVAAKIKADARTGCWLWDAALSDGGYGVVQYNGTIHRAHRVVYTCLVGSIPDKHVLDHRADICGNRACVFPGHLEPITNRANILRGSAPAAQHATKTHCAHGHEFTPENTRIAKRKPPRTPERQCLTCERIKDRARAANKRAKKLEPAA